MTALRGILIVLALSGCAGTMSRESAGLDLLAACGEPARVHLSDAAYDELDRICDPSAIRGRDVEQLRSDAKRVRAILGGGK